MSTLNNQLHNLGLRPGDTVHCSSWIGEVYQNEFGLGIAIRSSHDPAAICDGAFPALPGLKARARQADHRTEEEDATEDGDQPSTEPPEQEYLGDPD